MQESGSRRPSPAVGEVRTIPPAPTDCRQAVTAVLCGEVIHSPFSLYSNGWIYGRTSPGEKMEILSHHKWVAFEVDEVEGPYDWRSVVVRGGLYVLEPDEDAWSEALELIRAVVPGALGASDPTPFRTVLFRIAIQESTGREATSAPPG